MEKLLSAIANSSVKQQALLLPQILEYGELGVDFLIECLEDTELEIRSTAYQLLQGVDLEKARKAIAPGLLLNSGDKIYSVYKSSIWFTDDAYCLNDTVSYFDDVFYQVYGEEVDLLEEEEIYKSKRIFCYLEKSEAEEKAEALHRESIQHKNIGGLCFEWDGKEECLSYKKWCEQNLVNYQYNSDDWQCNSKLMAYLYVPENIELLSKFWKDGIGRFAFVQEEFVQQKIKIRIKKNLTKIKQDEVIKTEFIARPKNYQKSLIKKIVSIVEDKDKDFVYKRRARKMLQNIESEYIPF